MASRRISYRTATLELPLAVPRDVAWAAVQAGAAARADGVTLAPSLPPVTEVVLSDEPPWRRVVRLDGDHPSPLCQTTITIRDDGDRSLVAWSCLIDPTGVDPDALDTMADAVTEDGAGQLGRIAATVAD
jgi:hypothetical protein